LHAGLVSAFVALLVFTSAPRAPDWIQNGFAARHGSANTGETTLSRSNVGRLALDGATSSARRR